MTQPQSEPQATTRYDLLWAEAVLAVSQAGLPGLQIDCPRCQCRGTLVSKWQPKTPVKPLFVVHPNGDGRLHTCELDDSHVAAARDQVNLTQRDAIRTLRLGKPYVMFSGGNDSLCLLQYMKRLAERADVQITALHADTTAGFPEVEDFVVDVCHLLEVPLVTVRPDRDYFETAKRWGIPGVRSRWCCQTLKIAPMRRYLATVEGPKVVFDGIRAAESPVRAKYVPVWFHPEFRSVCVSPIFGWSDGKVASYLRQAGLPENPTAKLGTSGECWCGAYKCRADFEALLDVHPEIFDKLVEVEQAQDGKFTFIYEKGARVPLKSLRDNGTSA